MKLAGSAADPSPKERKVQPGRLRRFAGRYGWGLSDQILSSLTNFALGILVARTVSLQAFGVFSLAFATYLLALGISRAIASEPLTVRHSASGREEWAHAAQRATGTALSIGVIIGLACLLAAWIAGGELGRSLAALGVVMPGLLLQDSWRFAFFAGSRAGKALTNDLVWALVLFPTLGLLLVGTPPPVWAVILAWGGAASAAAIVGALQTSVIPRPGATISWIREHRRLVRPFLAEFTTGYGAGQLIMYAAGAVSLGAAGALRAGQLLLGPFFVLIMGMRLAVLPEAVRIAKQSLSALRRTSGFLGLFLAGAAVAWGGLIRVLPDPLGTALLGSAWDAGRQVVLPLAFASAASGLILGAEIGLRSLVSVRRSLRARLVTGAAVVFAGAGGALLHGALGAAIGTALGTWLAAGWWWLELLRALRTAPPLSEQPA
jgi:O-antigen/teichoic acid export membrane protein